MKRIEGVTYRIDTWSRAHGYQTLWQGRGPEMADRMMNKPYNRRHPRRLVRVETLIIRREPAEKR